MKIVFWDFSVYPTWNVENDVVLCAQILITATTHSVFDAISHKTFHSKLITTNQTEPLEHYTGPRFYKHNLYVRTMEQNTKSALVFHTHT